VLLLPVKVIVLPDIEATSRWPWGLVFGHAVHNFLQLHYSGHGAIDCQAVAGFYIATVMESFGIIGNLFIVAPLASTLYVVPFFPFRVIVFSEIMSLSQTLRASSLGRRQTYGHSWRAAD